MSTEGAATALRSVGGVQVTRLGFGTTGIAGLYRSVSESDAQAAVQAAWEVGIRHFDTAPAYGNGRAEERLGEALADLPRDEYVVSTKVGYVLERRPPGEEPPALWGQPNELISHFDFSRDATRRSFEESLRRLGLDRVDMVAIHDPDEALSIDPTADPYGASHFARAMESTYAVLDELRSEGIIRALGVGMNGTTMLADFAVAGDFDYFLLAGRYTLLEQRQALDELMPICVEKDIPVVVGGAFSSGILVTGAVEGSTYNYGPAPDEVLDRVRAIERCCEQHGVALPAAALQFPLSHPAVASVVCGARSADELRQNVELVSQPIPAEFWEQVRAEGLIASDAPVPSI